MITLARSPLAGWKLCLSIGALLLVTSTLEAQQRSNLTRAQEGRAEVAKCYARCLTSAEPMTEARIALDALDGEWSRATGQYVSCQLAQVSAQRQDACSAGCKDIEASYGVRSSYIRTRYYWHLNLLLRGVRASGLWTAWNRFPEQGSDAFIRACNRYIQAAANRRAVAARKLEAMEPLDLSDLAAKRQEVIANEYVPEPPPVWGRSEDEPHMLRGAGRSGQRG